MGGCGCEHKSAVIDHLTYDKTGLRVPRLHEVVAQPGTNHMSIVQLLAATPDCIQVGRAALMADFV
jgi:hypothetical protein